MPVGDRFPSERVDTTDPLTGYRIRRYTQGTAHSYPLYYFSDSITADGRRLILHRQCEGWTQLYALDLVDGHFIQLTDGRTQDAGWRIWCEPDVKGIYDHLSALNNIRGEVYYFLDSQLRAVRLQSLQDRLLASLDGRQCISQNDVSPDGRWFAFAHVDRLAYREAVLKHNWAQHQAWRRNIPTTITVLDVATGDRREVAELDFHVHHLIFVDDRRLLLNHVKNDRGMWTLNLDTGESRGLRPRDEHGTVCHQVVTRRGIFYEANTPGEQGTDNWLGHYDLETDQFYEISLPYHGYVHTGRDPAGERLVFEHAGDSHELVQVHHFRDPAGVRFQTIRRLASYPPHHGGQRYHAHPFFGPDSHWLYHTEVVDDYSQVAAIEIL